MRKEEIAKCVSDYLTCIEHSCGECSAFKSIKFSDGNLYKACELLNVLHFGTLTNEEDNK